MSSEGHSNSVSGQKVVWKNLKSRFFTAVIFAALCVAPFYYGGKIWAIFVAVLGARMVWEWVRMSDLSAGKPAYLLPIIGLWATLYAAQYSVRITIITLCVCGALVTIERLRRERALRSGFGFLYVSIPALFIVFLRGYGIGPEAPGFVLLLIIILVVIAADTFAYFGGSFFKGPKLAPSISPKKTWSGFICGLIGGMCIGGLAMHFVGYSFWLGFFWGFPTVLLSVLGDFVESWLKRRMMVKDAGGLLPGHGGILDRLDSLMLVVVAVGVILLLRPEAWPV